jgi:hypothetical protein
MSDTLFALWIGLSVVLLLLFLYAAVSNLRNRQTLPVALDELIPSFLPVDVQAFAEIIDGEREQQLEQGLSGKELANAQRERIALTIEFLRRMTQNAALLQRLGYSQLHSSNPLISDLAQQMIDAGVQVRLYTFVGLIVLRLCSVFHLAPKQIMPAARIAELQQMMKENLLPAYEQLKDKAGNLICLKFSGLHEALTQNL